MNEAGSVKSSTAKSKCSCVDMELGQPVHATAPVPSIYVPALQGEHSRAPSLSAYVPKQWQSERGSTHTKHNTHSTIE